MIFSTVAPDLKAARRRSSGYGSTRSPRGLIDTPIYGEGPGSASFKDKLTRVVNRMRDEYGKSDWAKENILIAVAGAETDGTSGIRDANDATLRQEIEKFAHVIFASSPAQRDFWRSSSRSSCSVPSSAS